MNTATYVGRFTRMLQKVSLSTRTLWGAPTCDAFSLDDGAPTIQRIYVINLDREDGRWRMMRQELHGVLDRSGRPLAAVARRFSAIDARYETTLPPAGELQPDYSLADQLYVEPNPLLTADATRGEEHVRMTRQEVAVARSHLALWKRIASTDIPYTLILEDDVYFRHSFARALSRTRDELVASRSNRPAFDLLYLSYLEARLGAEKDPVSDLVFRPRRGIWQLSGYVLSPRGAQRLLSLLPIRGPVDLWINHMFGQLEVLAASRSLIEQRLGVASSNAYSILPVLAKVGVLTAEKPLVFARCALPTPVFAWGRPGSGLSSLAAALSMLGYRCCHDVDHLPARERERLLTGSPGRVFDAYVNVGEIGPGEYAALAATYPSGKFIVTQSRESEPNPRVQRASPCAGNLALIDAVDTRDSDAWVAGRTPGIDAEGDSERIAVRFRWLKELPERLPRVLELAHDHRDKWEVLRRFLGCDYPSDQYPECLDQPSWTLTETPTGDAVTPGLSSHVLRSDVSPWIVPDPQWRGLRLHATAGELSLDQHERVAQARFEALDPEVWALRDDTFPSNLALFRHANFSVSSAGAGCLALRQERTPVREFTSAAIRTRAEYQYGRFRAEMKPAKGAGLISGFFLHRNGPRQEIDIEFLGRDTTKLLINVYFNPGTEGARMEYGYRGTPVLLDLGFDAAEDFHDYEIEWTPVSIRWRVDGRLAYERVTWGPTPIPHLPLQLNVNLWYSRSAELAGKLAAHELPALTQVRALEVFA